MIMLQLCRPILGNIGKRLIVGTSHMTKLGFAQDASQPVSRSSLMKEFLSKNEITINGTNMDNLRPILNFDEANFPERIIQELKKKFDAPSIIQAVSWPPVLAGRDLACITKTGPGKTLSFLLPALVHISKQAPIKRGEGPIIVVLCPTRELAQQVQSVASEWGTLLTRVRTMCAYEGVSRMPQELILESGVELIVATPGRLNDFLDTRVTNMQRCSYLVLDEADQMLNMGFEPQIQKIIDQINGERQTLMYSATWTNEVRQLAGNFMKNFVHIKIGSADLSSNKNITQAERDKKFRDTCRWGWSAILLAVIFAPACLTAFIMFWKRNNQTSVCVDGHGCPIDVRIVYSLGFGQNIDDDVANVDLARDLIAKKYEQDQLNWVFEIKNEEEAFQQIQVGGEVVFDSTEQGQLMCTPAQLGPVMEAINRELDKCHPL